TEVTADSPAAKAGLKAGDLITAADDTKIPSYEKLLDYYQGKKPGEKIKLTVTRDEKEITIEVTLGQRPGEGATEGTGAAGGGGRGGAGGGGGGRGAGGGGRGAGGGGRGAGGGGTGAGGGGAVLPPVTGIQFGTDEEKLVVEAVTEDGPAAQAGIKPGDVV